MSNRIFGLRHGVVGRQRGGLCFVRRPLVRAPSLCCANRGSVLSLPSWSGGSLVTTQRYTSNDSNKNKSLSPLELQRLRRPVSPHLTIYKWRYQSLVSILQRFSGLFLSGAVYVFATGYLLTPLILSASPSFVTLFDIDTIAAAVTTTLPVWAKMSAKFVLSLPFTYHVCNGVKQLVFDIGRGGLGSRQGIRMAAWIVAGCSLGGAAGLALI